MKKYKNSAKILLFVSYLLFVLLAVLVILLPQGARWYTDIKGRPNTLPTDLISTCYPCVPFAFLAIWEIRKVAKSILDDKAFTKATRKSIFVFGLCCLIAGLIMFVAGFFYFPFFIASGAALFCTLITKVFSDVLSMYRYTNPGGADKSDDPDSNADKEDNNETKKED